MVPQAVPGILRQVGRQRAIGAEEAKEKLRQPWDIRGLVEAQGVQCGCCKFGMRRLCKPDGVIPGPECSAGKRLFTKDTIDPAHRLVKSKAIGILL